VGWGGGGGGGGLRVWGGGWVGVCVFGFGGVGEWGWWGMQLEFPLSPLVHLSTGYFKPSPSSAMIELQAFTSGESYGPSYLEKSKGILAHPFLCNQYMSSFRILDFLTHVTSSLRCRE